MAHSTAVTVLGRLKSRPSPAPDHSTATFTSLSATTYLTRAITFCLTFLRTRKMTTATRLADLSSFLVFTTRARRKHSSSGHKRGEERSCPQILTFRFHP